MDFGGSSVPGTRDHSSFSHKPPRHGRHLFVMTSPYSITPTMFLSSSITGTSTTNSANPVAIGSRQEHPTTRVVVVAIAILFFLAVALWGGFGVLAFRRYRSNPNSAHTSTSLPTANGSQKRSNGAEEPKLWEVSLKCVTWEDYHDLLRVSHSVPRNSICPADAA